MSKTTHEITRLISFDDLLKHCMKESMLGFDEVSTLKVILLLSLTTGIKTSIIMTLKWKDLLNLGSENNAIVENELRIRNYIIPIHPRVRQQISEIYSVLGLPKLDSLIVEKLDKKATGGLDRAPEMMIRVLNSNKVEFLKKSNSDLIGFDFDECTRVLFGRKVLEVCGYTNKNSKMLKKHFELRLNKDLLDFLGFTSKEEIIYKLENINLDCQDVPIKFQDKNFNQGFPFQKFIAFSNFLLSGKTYYSEPVTNSIRLLLLMSLYNGVRPSTLIRLQWKDIIQDNEEEKTIEIVEKTVFEDYPIRINEQIKDKLLYHFELGSDKSGNLLETENNRYIGTNKIKYLKLIDINTPVFIMNTGNPITQPSLSREIKKALQQMGFPHAEKMTSTSTVIMYGRRVLEIKGNHKPTIKKLKEHFNFKSALDLFNFLHLGYKKTTKNGKIKAELTFDGKMRNDIFEEILYDL